MGTYTTNYNLFMPTVGEQGWGELVNGNFTTIDNTMKSLSNHIGTVEIETDARLATLEAGNFETITAGVGNFGEIITNGSLTFNKTTTVSFNSNTTIPWQTCVLLLPPIEGNTYTGSMQVYANTGTATIYPTNKDGNVTSYTIAGNTTFTYEIPANTVAVLIYGHMGWYRPIILS